jgi:dTDP-4-dehydrorhamnose 3,5-epimerase-like enzyme
LATPSLPDESSSGIGSLVYKEVMRGTTDELGDSGEPRVSTRSPRRFQDSRGATVLLVDGERLDFVEYLEFNSAGDVRGGHYHLEYEEQLHVISGELDAEFLDMSNDSPGASVTSFKLKSGTTVTIPPAVAHRFTAREPTRAVAFGKGSSPLVDRTDVDTGTWNDR